MATLEELLKGSRQSGHGCKICGEQTVAQVGVRMELLGPDGTRLRKQDGGRTVSRHVSLCEQHTVEVYGAVTAALDEALGR